MTKALFGLYILNIFVLMRVASAWTVLLEKVIQGIARFRIVFFFIIWSLPVSGTCVKIKGDW